MPGPDKAKAGQANALGNRALAQGDPKAARAHFETAVAADPGQPALLFNLAAACRAGGDNPGALAALDAALAADPYLVQALFQKAVTLEDTGDAPGAALIYRDFLDTAPPEVLASERFAAPLTRARAAIEADGAQFAGVLGVAPSARLTEAVSTLTGLAKPRRQGPTFLAIPDLPETPFLDRDLFPWIGDLEAGWEVVRDEARSVFDEGAGAFVPYVANPPGTPLNQWRELDHNRDWGSFFLWRHSMPDHGNCARLPRTAALLGRLPLLDIPRRGPNAFLSRLAPRTRIPAHNGVTNARVTVHLPLIVPAHCGFRVGGETRAWREGEAWVFDDTIEHEAWNDSGEPRLILIFDVWNPMLLADERAWLAAMLGVYDAHYGLAGSESRAF
jgi:aspartate beta-hydroxylase